MTTPVAGVFGFGVFAPSSLGGVFGRIFLFDAGESPERRFFFGWLAMGLVVINPEREFPVLV